METTTRVLTDEKLNDLIVECSEIKDGLRIAYFGRTSITQIDIIRMAKEILSLRQQVKDWREWGKEIDDDEQITGHDIAYQDLLNKYPEDK